MAVQRGKTFSVVVLVLLLRPAHAFSPGTTSRPFHRGASACSKCPFVPSLFDGPNRRPVLRQAVISRLRVSQTSAGDKEDSGSRLPQMPSIESVEFLADAIEDTESVSGLSLGRVEEIGLFPLGMILNPGAIIPLNIFEAHHCQLFNQAWEGKIKVGIVMYDQDRNQWARVGTFCKIIDFQTQPDGRIQTVSEGDERFRVLKVTRAGSQIEYAKALVEYYDDIEPDPDVNELEETVWKSLNDVLELSNQLYGKDLGLRDNIKALAPGKRTSEEGGEPPPERDTPNWRASERARQLHFSFAVCQVLDMPLLEQLLMLQLRHTSLRLRKQLLLLQQAKELLTEQLSVKQEREKQVREKEEVVAVKHPELFSHWQPDSFDPKFLELVERIKEGTALDELLERDLLHKEVDGVYSFRMLSIAFCDKFLEEVDNYLASGLPVRRPNSMNNYGLIVNDIGLEPSITHLQQEYILPLAKLLYPKQGSGFDGHHSFMVEYKAGHDLGLDMHTDDSDVTLNVCLGREFTGAGLIFCGSMGQPNHRQFSTQYRHKRGCAVIHLGTKRHGADDITSGERNSLIIWNHNYQYRGTDDYKLLLSHQPAAYLKEAAPPDLRCLSYTHDRDYEAFLDVPKGRLRRDQAAWCPPTQFCYDQMEPVAVRVAKRAAVSGNTNTDDES